MPDIEHTIFDTNNFCAHDRFNIWQKSISVIFDATLDYRVNPYSFQARVEAANFGQILLGEVVSQTQRFSRPKEKILSDGLDCYLLQVFKKGYCEVEKGQSVQKVKPGDIYIIDASAPLDAIDYDFSHLTAMIPRHVLSPFLNQPDAHHRHVISGDIPLAKLLYEYILSLHSNRDGMSQDDGGAASTALLSLTQSLLNSKSANATGDYDAQAVDLAIRSKIIDFIEDNLHNPKLGPSIIVNAFGISRTQLYRIFDTLNGVASEIRRRRLRRSLQDLLNPNHYQLNIGQIAFRWGFKSESDYSRAFKRQYQRSPSEARAARTNMLSSNEKLTNEYEKWIAGLAM